MVVREVERAQDHNVVSANRLGWKETEAHHMRFPILLAGNLHAHRKWIEQRIQYKGAYSWQDAEHESDSEDSRNAGCFGKDAEGSGQPLV